MNLNSNGEMASGELFLTSRSAIECYQHCHRKRLINYHIGEGHLGIVPVRRNINLLTGIAVHKGVETLLQVAKNEKPVTSSILERIVEEVKQWYVLEATTAFVSGPGTSTKEQQIWTIAEQRALIEALIRLWFEVEYPRIVNRFQILYTESEMTVDLGNKILLQSRVDAIFESKTSKEIYNYSLKTGKAWSAQLAQSFAVNLQTLTEIAAVNRNMQMHVTGTSFCHLIKGKREENKDRGVYMTKHPFIYGYRKGGLNGISYAHSFWFPNPMNESGKGRLGKGWEPFHVWSKKDGYEGGVKQWISDIFSGKIQPEYPLPDLIKNWCIVPVEHFRDANEVNSAIGEIEFQERTIFHHLYKTGSLSRYETFPMYREGCYWPTPCEYLPLCHGVEPYSNEVSNPDIAADPIGSGRYEVRVPHHELIVEG